VTLKSELEVTQRHSRHVSQIVIFFHTPLHSAYPLGGPRRNIVIQFGTEKLEWWGYQTWKNFEDMYNSLQVYKKLHIKQKHANYSENGTN